jgi:hypothetical protein
MYYDTQDDFLPTWFKLLIISFFVLLMASSCKEKEICNYEVGETVLFADKYPMYVTEKSVSCERDSIIYIKPISGGETMRVDVTSISKYNYRITLRRIYFITI